MILGIFIRNFKGYGETAFVPISNGDNFTAFIGENGAGKTTLLQALDCFFNRKEWQTDIFLKEQPAPTPFIQLLFLVPLTDIPENLRTEAVEMSRMLWHYKHKSHSHPEENERFTPLRELLASFPTQYTETHLLLTAATDPDYAGVSGVFESQPPQDTEKWLAFARSIYRYLCIPTNPEPEALIRNLSPESREDAAKQIPLLCGKYFNGLPAGLLDAEERQQLTLMLIHRMIRQKPSGTLIVGFDEPEATLQTASCYEHFEKIYQLHTLNTQILLTSHWYGFIPLLTSGLLVDIIRHGYTRQFIRFDISRFREEIKIRKRIYRERYHEELPVDITLKTVNDFIQSLIGSVINAPCYNWLICEGSSEMIYFNYYFAREIARERLRIVPVGGVREVRKIYSYLSVPFSDLQEYIRGNIVLLTDTDTQLLEFETPAIHHLYCYRLVNAHGESHLVHIKSNPKSPATEIEDVLNGKVFHQALLSFKTEYPELLDFVSEEEKPETASYYALDLSPSEKERLTAFFDAHHQIKTRFAEKYVAICREGNYREPEWIGKLRSLLIG